MVEGFKNTEVGVIPKDWELVSYDDVFNFYTTATYSRAQLSDKDEIGYVHYGDIHVKCLHFLDLNKVTLPTIKRELLKNYPTLKEGDVIIVDASEDYEGVGKSVEVRNLKDRKVISGLHTFLLRDNTGKIADGFKGYIHSNKLVKKQMDTLATGLKVYGVSKTNLKKILIPLPPTKVEQTAIANALNDADALINQLEQLLLKKRNIKTGAMQELLKPKEGWEVEKLGEVLKYTQLGGNYSNTTKPTEFPLIKMGNLQRGYISLSKVEFINQKADEKDRLHYGDLLFNTRNTLDLVGKVAIWRNELNRAYFNSNIMRMTFKEDLIITNFFANSLLNMPFMLQRLKDIATGTTSVAAIYTKDLIQIDFPFPNKIEQTRIAQILSDIDNEIQELEKKIEKYKMLKQGMMQSLLTGKIRLVVNGMG